MSKNEKEVGIFRQFLTNRNLSENTIDQYGRRLKHFLEQNIDVTSKEATEYVTNFKTGNSRNFALKVLKSYSKFLELERDVQTKFHLVNNFSTKDKKNSIPLPLPILKAFIEHVKGSSKQIDVAFELLSTRALRTIEVLRIRRRHLQSKDGVYYVMVQSKGASENQLQNVLIPKSLWLKLSKLGNDVLFSKKDGSSIDTSYLRRGLKITMKTVIEKMDPEVLKGCLSELSRTQGQLFTPYKLTQDFSCHAFRHTLSQLLIINGEPAERLLRHQAKTNTDIYTQGIIEEVRLSNPSKCIETKLDLMLN